MIMILGLLGLVSLAVGGMLLFSPDKLYEIVTRLTKYLNKTCISSDGDFACRMAIAGGSLSVGLSMVYVAYYYSQYNTVPPIVTDLLTKLLIYFGASC